MVKRLPDGVTVEKNKDTRGRITGYTARQGRSEWTGKTEAEALAMREAEIAWNFAQDDAPRALRFIDGSGKSCLMLSWFRSGTWQHGLLHDESQSANGNVVIGCSGAALMRSECERSMRRHAADLAIWISKNGTLFDDGCDLLRDASCTVEDVRDQLIRAAWQCGNVQAEIKGLTGRAADEFADLERGKEATRIRALIASLPSGIYSPLTSARTAVDILRGDFKVIKRAPDGGS